MSKVRKNAPISSAVSGLKDGNFRFNFGGYFVDCRGEERSDFPGWHFHPMDSDLSSSQRLLNSRFSASVGRLQTPKPVKDSPGTREREKRHNRAI